MPNVFLDLAANIRSGVYDAMNRTGAEIVDTMRETLRADGHAGTGDLIDSINYDIKQTNDEIIVNVNAADYAKYLESGTGAAHGVSGGREGYWRYQDRDGNWHTTDGMDADPFIDPSTQKAIGNLPDVLAEHISYKIKH